MRFRRLRTLLATVAAVGVVCLSAGAGAWAVVVGSEVPRPVLTTTLQALPPASDPGEAGTEGDADPGGAGGEAVPEPAADRLAAFLAPRLIAPLQNLDPGLATRGPRPSAKDLLRYQYGAPGLMFDPKATPLDWQLSRPDPNAVRGFADEVSVLPGQTLGLRLNGVDHRARVDVFRMGAGDARHMLTVSDVPIVAQPEADPRFGDGLVEEAWPRSTTLRIPASWPSGVYLAKLTGDSGGQSYIVFIVRPSSATPLTVVLPITTYEAYNLYGGADLYAWPGGPQARAYEVSFDRPFEQEYGAGLFFRLDFPLIAWLEDHGYAPGYIADIDVGRTPGLALGSWTLLFSGHGEYWTGATRATVEAAAERGTNLAFFGANQAFWQIRLAGDGSGRAARTIICFKSALLDPTAARSPADATVRFADPPVSRPPADLMGLHYAGVVDGIAPMVVGEGMLAFDAGLGLLPGQLLPGLIADEVDGAPRGFTGLLLGATPITVHEHAGTVTAATALWIAPNGSRVFEAGSFDFSWGLDPRYAAALPGFPAEAFSTLTAEILAWLGTQPAR